MRKQMAGLLALTLTTAAIELATTRQVAAQHWVPGVFGSPRLASIRQLPNHKRQYYRGGRSVPLGGIVAATGTDTRAAWQARLTRDERRIGIAPRIGPRDRDGDGVDDPFDRWPNDPSRW